MEICEELVLQDEIDAAIAEAEAANDAPLLDTREALLKLKEYYNL